MILEGKKTEDKMEVLNSYSWQMWSQSLVLRVHKEFRGPQVPLVFKDLLVLPVCRVQTVKREQREHLAPRGLQGPRVQTDFRALQVLQEKQGLVAHGVCVALLDPRGGQLRQRLHAQRETEMASRQRSRTKKHQRLKDSVSKCYL